MASAGALTRLALAVLAGAALLLPAHLLLRTFYAFEGELFVSQDQWEQRAVRGAGTALTRGLALRNVPASALALQHEDAPFQQAGLYDALDLPFSVHLRGTHVLEAAPPRRLLEIISPESSRHVDLALEQEIETSLGVFHAEASVPWTGLVRDARGSAMAALHLLPEPARPVLLQAGAWRLMTPELCLALEWAENEDRAREALAGTLPLLSGASWRIEDAGRVHSLSTFTPGAGITLSDDAEVTLLAVQEPEGPEGTAALHVSVRRDGAEERHRITANTPGPISFFCPAAARWVVLLSAWSDNRAWLGRYQDRQLVDSWRVEEGRLLEATETFPQAMRVDQVMEHALPVEASAGVQALPLRLDGETRLLREGSLIRWDGLRLRYQRLPVPARERWIIELREGDTLMDGFELQPGTRYCFRGWCFMQAGARAAESGGAVLHVQRLAPPAWPVWPLVIFVVLLVFRMQRKARCASAG